MDSDKKGWMSRVGIIVIAALLVETISIIQYQRLRDIMHEEIDTRGRVILRNMTERITHTLELTENTMNENVWDVKRSMAHPDSLFPAMVRLIDDNPNVVGGCIAFIPYYYPSKGRLFEPYASKNPDGTIEVTQLAGEGHDYTLNDEYIWVLEHDCTSWTDPYKYGPDSLDYATYSYPIRDTSGTIVAICGLDIDLSWLGQTLNSRPRYPSSFSVLLTEDGELVAHPSQSRMPRATVDEAVASFNGTNPQSNPEISFRSIKLNRDPYWQLVQFYKPKEMFANMRRLRRQQMLYVLLGLAILAFMINSYARNETRLRLTSEEKARISGELTAARSIQQQMLPKTFPSFVYGSLEPARAVGGDLFDFYMRDGKLFFCIGDVSGKGVPSSMHMSVAHSLFRLVSQKEESPAVILSTMNRELCRGNESNMFMTFFVGCLDLYSGVLYFGNAGHDKPFVLTDKQEMLDTKANLPLGVFPDTHFEEQCCTLAPGTILFLYTDGLTEAKNVNREQFGKEGVMAVLNSFISGGDLSLEKLVSSMSEAAHGFAGAAPQSDDLTMLAVRYDPGDIQHEELVISNNLSDLPRFSDFVKEFCSRLDIEKRLASNLRLALEEVVVNVINYAYPKDETGSISVKADSDGKQVRFVVVDSGVPFDPTSVLEADTTLDAERRPIGGLGVHLARKLTDSISYSRRNGHNVLTLTKSIL